MRKHLARHRGRALIVVTTLAAASVAAVIATAAPRPFAIVVRHAPPSGLTRNRAASIDWTTTRGGAMPFSCRRDGGTPFVCRPEQLLAHLRDGRHSFIVAASYRGVTVRKSYAWTVDATAPHVVASGGSSAWSAEASATLSAQATDHVSGVASVQHRTDSGAGYGPAAPGGEVVVSAEGTTRVEFRAVDHAGNVSAWTPPQTARLDRTAPTAPTVSDPQTWVKDDFVQASGSDSTDAGSGVDHYEYETQAPAPVCGAPQHGSTAAGVRHDVILACDNPWSAPTSGPVATITDEGQSNVRFRAVDGAGNASDWTESPVRLDHTAPWLGSPLNAGTVGSTTPDPVTLAYPYAWDATSGIFVVWYRTSADGSSWGVPTVGSSVSYSGPATDIYVEFEALDNAGNRSGWSAPEHVIIAQDPTPTVPTITGNDVSWHAAPVSLTAAATSLNGVTGYHWQYSTDSGGTWQGADACDGSDSCSASIEGDVLYRADAYDGDGHTGGWSDPAEVKLDETAPSQPTIWFGNADWTSSTGLGAHSTDNVGVDHYVWTYSTDSGNTWTPIATGLDTHSIDLPVDGQYLVRVVAVDAAGNTSDPQDYTAKLDRGAPTVSIDHLTGMWAWPSLDSPIFVADPFGDVVHSSASDDTSPIVDIQCEVVDVTAGTDTFTDDCATYNVPDAIALDKFSVRVRSKDAAGNWSEWSLAFWHWDVAAS